MEFSQIWADYSGQIIATAVAILAYIFLKYVLKKIIKKYGELTHKAEARMLQMRHTMAVLLNIALIFSVVLIWGLTAKNVLVGLATAFAFLGVAMFAQWSVLSNITAGIVMFFSAPYHLGDKIRVMDKDIPIVATIENIGIFYTHIRSTDGELIVLPNNIFLQKVIAIINEEEE